MSKKTLREQERVRLRGISRITRVGLWVNVLLCCLKMGAGYLANSRAVMADGVHSLSDCVTSVVILIGVRFWMAPADAGHPYGHQRLESLVTLCIGFLLVLTAAGIAFEGVMRIREPSAAGVNGPLALAIAVISVLSKEALFRWTLIKGKDLRSDAVEASAWDHRSDAVSSLPIVVSASIAMFRPEWAAAADLLGAVLIAAFIMHAAWNICAPALNTLLDKGADPALCQRIISLACETPGVLGAHALRTRYMGRALAVDLHVCVEATLTVAEGNRIAHAVEELLRSEEATGRLGLEIYDVLAHIDPLDSPDSAPNSEQCGDAPLPR